MNKQNSAICALSELEMAHCSRLTRKSDMGKTKLGSAAEFSERVGVEIPKVSFADRFFSGVLEDDNGCWNWVKGKSVLGYGRFAVVTKMNLLAHRVSYLIFHNEIPHGMSLDHKCRNRACVNPSHLEPVTHEENCLRGVSVFAENKRKVECVHGHLLTGYNVIQKRGGGRECRECKRIKDRKNYARKSNVR